MDEEQVGGGQKLWNSNDHDTLRQIASRNLHKFNTTATDYLLSLNAQSEEQPSRTFCNSLCLARAIVTDIARQDKDPEWNSIWQGRKEQRLLAQQLHLRASVQEGLCGIPEVDKFQKVIDNYQIIVLSAKHFNAIVYKGPRREKQIYLYHYVNHFDIITSVSSFLGRSYWCLECMKGYNEKEKHRCSKVCKCCFTEGCVGITQKAAWQECGTCHRIFARDECYANHCRPTREGQSVSKIL